MTRTASLDPEALVGLDRSEWSVADRQAELLAVRRLVAQLGGVAAQLLTDLHTAAPEGQVQVANGQWVSVAGWLADAELLHVNTVAAQVHDAARLVELPAVRAGVQDGSVGPAQAKVLAGLVGRLEPAHLAAAEPVLIEMAQTYHPPALTGRLRVWLAEHHPEVFAADEDKAADAGWVQLDAQSDGRHKLHGYLPSGQCEPLLTALASLSVRAGEDDRRPLRQRRADALLDLAARSLAAGDLPDTGGLPAQVSLVIHCDKRGTPAPIGMAAHAGPVAPWLTALWTCDADLTPIALRTDGQVLAMGRTLRNSNRAQRRALNARDGGCVARGCSAPPSACDAHHLTHWADGGNTDLNNMILLCRHHHRQWHRGLLGLHQLRLPWLAGIGATSVSAKVAKPPNMSL